MPIISYVVQRNSDGIMFDVSKVLKTLPLPDVLIVVTANTDTIIKRYSDRGGPRIHSDKSRQKIIVNSLLYNEFAFGHKMLEEITALLKKKVKVLFVDNNKYVDDNELRSIIRRVLND